jgi:outer membrane protein assembly factor BamB
MGARLCYCLDALNGTLFWMSKKGDYSTDPSLTGANQEISSSVAVVSDVAVILAGAVFGYDFATGALLWQAPDPHGYACAMATPVPFSDDRIIYGGRDQLNCLQAKTGKILWKLPAAGARLYAYAITPVISSDILLALSNGQLRAFDLGSATPRELWHILYGDPYSTPAADAECCYMIDPGFTYTDGVGHSNGPGRYAVTCRDLRTGRVLWQTPIPESQYTSPILVSGKVFVLTDGCRVIKMLDARDGRVLASAPVAACDWSSPSVAHGKLFVRIRHGVACYDLRPQP